MLPRLQAEERLAAITDGSVAMGTASRELTRETIKDLQRMAEIARPKTRRVNPAALAAMGIGISSLPEPPKEAPSDG